MRKILIRFDDICPTMNFEEFDKAIDLMDELDIKPLIGVIPKCEDDILKIDAPKRDFWEYVRNLEKKGYTIAMHGYKHVYDSNKHGMANASNRSEFAGHSFAVQYMKVKKGKEILETKGIHTSIFFAPSHSYDKTTLKVLSKCGFKYISDGMSRVPIERYGIVCIPCRTGGIPVMKRDGDYTAVFHAHEWGMDSKNSSYEEFEQFCRTNKMEICTFDIFCKQKVSKKIWDKIDERIYVIFQCRIRPILSKIKHKIV